jgi:hypothetical protein
MIVVQQGDGCGEQQGVFVYSGLQCCADGLRQIPAHACVVWYSDVSQCLGEDLRDEYACGYASYCLVVIVCVCHGELHVFYVWLCGLLYIVVFLPLPHTPTPSLVLSGFRVAQQGDGSGILYRICA